MAIKNRKRLRKKLQALPLEIQKHIAPALEQSANTLVALQKQMVPFRTGNLHDSINWVYGDAPRGTLSGGVKKRSPKALINSLKVTVFAGGGDAFYARFVEFGTKAGVKGERVPRGKSGRMRKIRLTHPGNPPQPFFYPAYRLMRKGITADIRNAVHTAIKKTATISG